MPAVNLVDFDREESGPEGWDTGFQGPECQGVAPLYDSRRALIWESYLLNTIAINRPGAGLHNC